MFIILRAAHSIQASNNTGVLSEIKRLFGFTFVNCTQNHVFYIALYVTF